MTTGTLSVDGGHARQQQDVQTNQHGQLEFAEPHPASWSEVNVEDLMPPAFAVLPLVTVVALTVAALLPRNWDCRLVDGNVRALDDRDLRPGAKFKDADLVGIPTRVTIGERGLREDQIEIRDPRNIRPRAASGSTMVPQRP